MKNYFFAWSELGAFGVILTMQLEPPKSYSKVIVMEKKIALLMLATPRMLRPYGRKGKATSAVSGRDTTHANMAAMANTVLTLLSEWCALLVYVGHLVQ